MSGEPTSGAPRGGRPSGEAPGGGVRGGRPPGEGPAPADGVAPDALRDLVREVLQDVLPGLAGPPSASGPAIPPAPPAPGYVLPAAPPASGAGPRPAPPASGYVPRPVPPASGYVLPAAPPTSDPGPPPVNPPASEPGSPLRPAAMAGAGGPAPSAGGYEAPSRPDRTVRPIRLATDEELHEFVLQVIALADNPKRRRDLLAGRLRFTLAPAGAPGPADHRIEKGAVTERAVQAAASAGARLVLGPRAVLTPLARDRARALGVPIEKER